MRTGHRLFAVALALLSLLGCSGGTPHSSGSGGGGVGGGGAVSVGHGSGPESATGSGAGMASSGMTASATTGSGGSKCGSFGEPCCPGSACTSADLTCSGGTCTQMRSGETGRSCAQNSDCASGICLPVGGGRNVCTTPCSGVSDCVSGWSCGALVGQTGNICQCTAQAEACNGKDDDCNGIVDDEPAVEAACNTEHAGFVCKSGQCSCAPENQCGGSCVDTKSDPDHCGSCTNACPSGAACSDGQCGCGGGSSLVCGGECVGTSTTYHACGGACAKNDDPRTCGTSCTACPTTAHGAATCDGHQCGTKCDTGYSACSSGCCEDCQTSGCSSGDYCDPSTNLCKTGCAHNTDCGMYQFCVVSQHACIDTTNNTCPTGYKLWGACTSGANFCYSDLVPAGTTFQSVCPAGTTARGDFICGGDTYVCIPNN